MYARKKSLADVDRPPVVHASAREARRESAVLRRVATLLPAPPARMDTDPPAVMETRGPSADEVGRAGGWRCMAPPNAAQASTAASNTAPPPSARSGVKKAATWSSPRGADTHPIASGRAAALMEPRARTAASDGTTPPRTATDWANDMAGGWAGSKVASAGDPASASSTALFRISSTLPGVACAASAAAMACALGMGAAAGGALAAGFTVTGRSAPSAAASGPAVAPPLSVPTKPSRGDPVGEANSWADAARDPTTASPPGARGSTSSARTPDTEKRPPAPPTTPGDMAVGDRMDPTLPARPVRVV
jgi:hypothetical protein